jgi:ABC-2 type transport system permease protein
MYFAIYLRRKANLMKKYFAFFKLGIVNALKNYQSLIGISIFLVTCLIIFSQLWKIATLKNYLGLYTRENLLWYIAFNEWILIAIPEVQLHIEDDYRTGRLLYQLPKPVSYLGSVLAENLGVFFVNFVVLGVTAFLFTAIKFHAFPFGLPLMLLSLILGFAAGLLAILFQMVIGLSSFWLHEVGPLYWIWEKFLFMCGGLLLPLTLYPGWIQKVAYFTPFPVILGQRSFLLIDFNINSFFWLLLSLLGWGMVSIFLLKIVYKRGIKILNIGGG